MIDKYCSIYVSRKIAVLSTLATIAVAIIHSNSLERYYESRLVFSIGNVIAFLQHWAVPFFFMVSGFFFDRAFAEKPIIKSYYPFLLKKLRSLGLPYLLWGSVIGFLLMTPLKMIVNHQQGVAVLSGTIFAEHGVLNIADRVLGVSGGNFVGALWYIRVLLVAFLTSPIWVGLRKISKWLLPISGFGLILCFSAVSGGGGEERGEKFGFFCLQVSSFGWILLGMAVSAFKLEELKIPRNVATCAALLWVIMSAIVIVNRFELAPWNSALRIWFRIAPIFLIIAWWRGGDCVIARLPEKLPVWFSYRFWIYCMHHPITAWVGGVVYAVVGHGLPGKIVVQCVQAPITLFACIYAAVVVKKHWPKAFAVLCGGR